MRRAPLLLSLLLIAIPLSAAIIRVPQDAPTIQAGLDSLQNGDTVLVAVGSYSEALIAPALTFTLMGDVTPDTGDYPRPIIDPSLLPDSDSLACLRLPLGSQPTLVDLRFRNGPEMYPRVNSLPGGIRSWSMTPRLIRCQLDSLFYGFSQHADTLSAVLTFESCQFRHDSVYCLRNTWCTVIATDCYVSGKGFLIFSANHHSRITSCQFEGNDQGYLFRALGHDVEIRDCVFGPRPSWPFSAVQAQIQGRITGSVFVDCLGSPYTLNADGLELEGVVIDSNVFVQTGTYPGSAPCQLCVNWQPDQGAGVIAVLRNNVFAQCSTAMSTKAIFCWNGGAVITHNRIYELRPEHVSAVYALQVPDSDHVTMNLNLFWHNGVAASSAIQNFDARWNWWGHESGPYHSTQNPQGQGDEVQGNLWFDPWCLDTTCNLSVPGINLPLPAEFVFEAYPNPFNSTVTFKLIPSEVMIVRVDLFDILGRRVKEIWSGPLAFQKQIAFDATNLSSGIYFARVWQPIGNRPLAMAKLVMTK